MQSIKLRVGSSASIGLEFRVRKKGKDETYFVASFDAVNLRHADQSAG